MCWKTWNAKTDLIQFLSFISSVILCGAILRIAKFSPWEDTTIWKRNYSFVCAIFSCMLPAEVWAVMWFHRKQPMIASSAEIENDELEEILETRRPLRLCRRFFLPVVICTAFFVVLVVWFRHISMTEKSRVRQAVVSRIFHWTEIRAMATCSF